MMVKFQCSGCSQVIRVQAACCGKRVKCPQCGAISRVPQAKPPAADSETDRSQSQVATQAQPLPVAVPLSPADAPPVVPTAIPLASGATSAPASPPAVQVAADSEPRFRRGGRGTSRSSRGKHRHQLVLLAAGSLAAVALTAAIGVFLVRSQERPSASGDRDALGGSAVPASAVGSSPAAAAASPAATEPQQPMAATSASGDTLPAAAADTGELPAVADAFELPAAAGTADRPSPTHATELPPAAGSTTASAEHEFDPVMGGLQPAGSSARSLAGSTDPPPDASAEPPADPEPLPRVEFDTAAADPPSGTAAAGLPEYVAGGLTQEEVGRLLERYDNRSLFSVKEYPALRRMFAERFQRTYAEEIQAAWGEEASAITGWLDEHSVLKEELFLAIDPQADDVSGALRVFRELKDRFPKQIVQYGNLAIAHAVTWDQPRAVYDYSGHQRRAKATLPEGALDAADNFAYFLQAEQFLQGRGQWLPWEFLVHTIDHKTPLPEREWAVANYLPARQMIGKCYHDVPYDHLMLETGSAQARLNEREYTLPNLRTYGGVCAMQADFAARVGKSLGVPAAYVGGESAYGDLHAWVMWVELKTVTPKSIVFSLESYGRYRGDKYYVGSLTDPKSAARITDRQLELRLHTVGMDPIAKRHADLVMAAFPAIAEARSLTVNERFAYMSRTVELCPGNERAWIELAGMSDDPLVREKHRKQMAAILNQLFVTFANFPDFTWTIFDDLIAYEERLKERINLYERLVLLYQAAQRPDLASQARQRLTDLLIEDGRQLEAVEGLAATVQAFVDEGRYVPALLDRIELICRDLEGSTPHLLRFYHSFLPKIPQMRGDRPSKYCMQMFERGIKLFQEHGEFAAAEAYRVQLAEIQAGRGRRSG